MMLGFWEEYYLWIWWNYEKHGGNKPEKKAIIKAKEIARKHKLSDNDLEKIWERWSKHYLPEKVKPVSI